MYINYNIEKVRNHMYEGGFGLEKESLRINSNGTMAKTKHPFSNDEYIQKDFCENQVEMVTKVCHSTHEVYDELLHLQTKVSNTLFNLKSGREYLWPFSNPPHIDNDGDIYIAQYHGALKGKEIYRNYLSEKYGKRKMLFCGIHYNFSFSDDLLIRQYEQNNQVSFRDFKDSVYLDLAKRVTQYSWFLVYLTSASPVIDQSFYDDNTIENHNCKYSSYRCSVEGYWNDFIPILDYSTIENYTKSIEEYILNGQLKSASELYYPVRLKPQGENTLENLTETGVNHIELRMFDVNPLSQCGFFEDDIEFIHLFIIYLSSLSSKEFGALEQTIAIKNSKKSAIMEADSIFIENENFEKISIRNAGIDLVNKIETFYTNLNDYAALEIIKKQKIKIYNNEERYAEKVKKLFKDNYVAKGISLSESYGRKLLCANYSDLVVQKK